MAPAISTVAKLVAAFVAGAASQECEKDPTTGTCAANYGCTDTADWGNGVTECVDRGFTEADGCSSKGWTCKRYGTNWCKNGKAVTGMEFALGANFNFPEQHCCACGKTGGEVAAVAGGAQPPHPMMAEVGNVPAPPLAPVCEDTPGWTNGIGACRGHGVSEADGCLANGYACKYYGKQWCKDGKARPGNEWALGVRFKSPEDNCCACGKSTHTAAAKAAAVPPPVPPPPPPAPVPSPPQCVDTPNWGNGHVACRREGIPDHAGCSAQGYTCKYYGSNWCTGGKANAGLEWTLGNAYKNPEAHCCACGKKAAAAPATSAPASSAPAATAPVTPKAAGETPPAATGNEEEYLVDNRVLKSAAEGIEYRLNKDMFSRAGHDHYIMYGQTIKGVDEGDGWLRVGTKYLPMMVRGVPVVTRTSAQPPANLPVDTTSTASPSAPKCEDTPDWNNGFKGCANKGYSAGSGCMAGQGFGCNGYKIQNWCADGSFVAGNEWSGGGQFMMPELHCCICGGGSVNR